MGSIAAATTAMLTASERDSETRAWEADVWVHARLIYRIAFSVLRNQHDAEDAVQETLQRAWKYRARLQAVENPAAWLARIAWRVAKSHRPRPGMVSVEELNAVAELRSHGATADDLAANHELRQITNRMIQTLPEKLRQPLLLSTVEELSAREIGMVLGIPEASVRTRCLRARRLLKDKLTAALEGHHGA